MTDYKQLCAELVDDLELCDWPFKLKETIRADIDRARAALAEPEPEGPADINLLETLREMIIAFSPRHPEALGLSAHEYEVELELRKVRACLARWGNHPRSPDSSLQPIPVSECLPGPGDCDAEGLCWVWNTTAYTWGLFRLDLTVHSHWLPAHALPQPS